MADSWQIPDGPHAHLQRQAQRSYRYGDACLPSVDQRDGQGAWKLSCRPLHCDDSELPGHWQLERREDGLFDGLRVKRVVGLAAAEYLPSGSSEQSRTHTGEQDCVPSDISLRSA